MEDFFFLKNEDNRVHLNDGKNGLVERENAGGGRKKGHSW